MFARKQSGAAPFGELPSPSCWSREHPPGVVLLLTAGGGWSSAAGRARGGGGGGCGVLSAPGEDRDRAGSPFGRRLCPERGPGPVSFLERLPSGFFACSPPCRPSPPEDAYIGQHRLLPATLQSNPVAFMTSLI
ncbi:hypothetical protein NN561_006722 [Cricetulus griseus]